MKEKRIKVMTEGVAIIHRITDEIAFTVNEGTEKLLDMVLLEFKKILTMAGKITNNNHLLTAAKFTK